MRGAARRDAFGGGPGVYPEGTEAIGGALKIGDDETRKLAAENGHAGGERFRARAEEGVREPGQAPPLRRADAQDRLPVTRTRLAPCRRAMATTGAPSAETYVA